MKTLIELYDERQIENVIAAQTFSPQTILYLCPEAVIRNKGFERTIRAFFKTRGMAVKTEFFPIDVYRADLVYKQLCGIVERYPDCVLDISGGTDAALFAAGMICYEKGTPAFTYSRKDNRFYNIHEAPYTNGVSCDLQYSVADFFALAGGSLERGRVDNIALRRHFDTFPDFFRIYMRFRIGWKTAVTFFQRISQSADSLSVAGSLYQKGDHGRKVTAPRALLTALGELGYLLDLELKEDTVSFRFADSLVRGWLRDIGSVLELFMYHECVEAGIFNDVVSSAVVNWMAGDSKRTVSNEIDVAASMGILPLFISCKTCDIHTDALNELSILCERFGGKGCKAAIVSTAGIPSAARHRAAQLGIAVIDREELRPGLTAERLKVIMKVRDMLPDQF